MKPFLCFAWSVHFATPPFLTSKQPSDWKAVLSFAFYLLGYSVSTNFLITGRARLTFSVSIQYAMRKYPGQPKESAGTNTKSDLSAFSQNAFASSYNALGNI